LYQKHLVQNTVNYSLLLNRLSHTHTHTRQDFISAASYIVERVSESEREEVSQQLSLVL